MQFQETVTQEGMQLSVEGKIDAISSNEFQTKVLSAFQRSNNLIIDMGGVTYMSSAGLRALMLGQKTAQSKGGKLTIINVTDIVRDVFRATGFDKIMDIR